MYFGYITTVYGVLRIKYYFSIILYGNGCEYVVLQNNRYVLSFLYTAKGTTDISSKPFSFITQELVLFVEHLQTDSDSLENQQNHST
jgi:hypothetical protein